MSLVVVHLALNPAEAQLIQSRLEAAGLHPNLDHELAALSTEGYALATGGVAVQVPKEEEAAARTALQATSDT